MHIAPHDSYIEFTFLDPRSIPTKGINHPELVVGTFVHADYSVMSAFAEQSPERLTQQIAAMIGYTPLTHTAEDRRTLQYGHAVTYDRYQLFYCWICAGRLEPDHCDNCGVIYPGGSITGLRHVRPNLPTDVALYVVGPQIGHQFAH